MLRTTGSLCGYGGPSVDALHSCWEEGRSVFPLFMLFLRFYSFPTPRSSHVSFQLLVHTKLYDPYGQMVGPAMMLQLDTSVPHTFHLLSLRSLFHVYF